MSRPLQNFVSYCAKVKKEIGVVCICKRSVEACMLIMAPEGPEVCIGFGLNRAQGWGDRGIARNSGAMNMLTYLLSSVFLTISNNLRPFSLVVSGVSPLEAQVL